jgi:hypothetical protein
MQYKMSKYAHKYAVESLKYALESLEYQPICTINPKYASISNELK